jgi:Protein of unknown function (DUF2796)
MNRLFALVTLCAALLATIGPAHAAEPRQATGHAHQHGVAKMELVLEPRQVHLHLEVPLDNLLGFERAPRNAQERQRADAAISILKAADALFVIDPAAGCRLASVELESAALQLGTATAGGGGDGHAELEAAVRFDCQDGSRATAIDVGLFKAFSRMHKLEVVGSGPKGQFKRSLKRPATRLELTPAR